MLCDNILPNLNISRLLIDRLYTDVKITYNAKMIHIMISFSDYQNSYFYWEGSLQTQKLVASLYFTNFCSDKHVFSSHAKSCFFQLKNVKNSHSSTSDSLEYTKSCTKKRHAPSFPMRVDLNRD